MTRNLAEIKKRRKKHLSKNLQFQRINNYLRQIFYAGLLLSATIIIGVTGFMFIGHYTFIDAVYMTIITLSTVGYGEVGPLDFWGRIFVSFLIVSNIGIFTYAVSVLSRFIIEGDYRKFMTDYNTIKRIQNLKNHTIVCGYGRHGAEVIAELSKSNLPYVVIEPDKDKVQLLRDNAMNFIEGDATQDKILLEAGIEDAKAIVITFNEDAFNVYTVLTARQLNHKLRIITRASNQLAEKKLLSAGANHVVLSEVIGGFYMATLVNQPKAVEFFQLLATVTEESTVQLKELNYKELKAEFKGKSFQHIFSQATANVNLIAIKNADSKFVINPSKDLIIQKGMSFVILGEAAQVTNFENNIIQQIHDSNLNA